MSAPALSPWSIGRQLAFRVFFLFFAHFAAISAPLGRIPGVGGWLQGYNTLWRPCVELFGRHVLRLEGPVLRPETGYGSSLYSWVLLLCYLSAAVLGALAWSFLAGWREPSPRTRAWLAWIARFHLSCALIRYGMIKLVPTQMIAPPPPGVLLFRVGDLVPNHLLWWFVGASPAFESVTGLAELLAGLLLLVPRTTLAGALLATADMATVFALNLAYDVPVKVYSLQLLVLAAVLVFPERRRLANLFLLNRRVEPSTPPPLSTDPHRQQAAKVALLLVGLFALGESVVTTRERYAKLYPPRSPFYGAWSVESYALDGYEMALYRDPERWRWVTFAWPGRISVERMDGTAKRFEIAIDEARKTLTLSRPPASKKGSPAAVSPPVGTWVSEAIGSFAYRRQDVDHLQLEGQLEGRKMTMRLEKMELLKRRRAS